MLKISINKILPTNSNNVSNICLLINNKIISNNRKYTSSNDKQQDLTYQEKFNIKNEAIVGKRPLYLDAQATTPLDPRVLDSMMPFMVNLFGNPHSRTHAYGWETEHAVEDARKQVADLIGAESKEIIFTSGATESNNIAVKGVARFYDTKKNMLLLHKQNINVF